MFNESPDPAFVLENVLAFIALVDELDPNTRVKERQLAQSTGQDIEVKLDVGERVAAGLEAQRCALPIRVADNLERRLGLTVFIFLLMGLTLTVNCQHEMFRESVYHRYADAMQTTRDFVGIIVKFSAGMQNRHDDLSRRAPFLGVQINRDAATIVSNCHRFVGMNRDRNRIAISRQRLIDRVIDDLKNHVVKTGAVIGVADVHARPLSNGLETL
jgi:hypothetical protein